MVEKDNMVTYEVESRLDELFMEEKEDIADDAPDEKNPGLQNRLRDLKAVVLSIDWEINDDILTSLLDHIRGLKEEYKNDHIILLFLRLLESVGKYIKMNKVNAHPDSIKLLSSVFQGFEKVVHDSFMPDSKQKKILQTEIKRFKELQEQIASKRRRYEKPKKTVPTPEQEETIELVHEVIEPSEHKALADENSRISAEFVAAVEQIKAVIQSEFKALRAELRQWRKENQGTRKE